MLLSLHISMGVFQVLRTVFIAEALRVVGASFLSCFRDCCLVSKAAVGTLEFNTESA